MTLFRADLHCHSTCSDGSLQPTELVDLAIKSGLKGLAITDHDTIDAYKTAIPTAVKNGLQLISGVEFSTVLGDVSVHILGYAFSLQNTGIQTFCKKHQQRRLQRNNEILALLTEKGMPITEEELILSVTPEDNPSAIPVIGRPHIAKLMVKKNYVTNIREAFHKHIGEGRPCYAKGNFFTPEETIKVIHEAKGFAVIAHPHLVDSSKTLTKLLQLNFDGIECYYAKFPASDHEPWLKIARHRNWMITGGSDFHGDIKPMIPLGCSWVDEDHFNILQNRFLENNQ